MNWCYLRNLQFIREMSSFKDNLVMMNIEADETLECSFKIETAAPVDHKE